jgi:putative ABC transport system permease protein
MAWRQARGARRRQALLVGTIAVGVAALVAINSFTDNLQRSVREQAREILGADLYLSRSTPYTPEVEAGIEALAADAELPGAEPGADLARITRFAAMARLPGGHASLVDVSAVSGDFPFYGRWRTEPSGRWGRLEGAGAIAEPAVLTQLGAAVGDTIALGEARFEIRATVHEIPGDVSLLASLGPRLFISGADLDATRLVGFGSRVRYETYLRLPAGADPQALADAHRARLDPERVVIRTVSEREGRLNEQLGRLGRYLGLVALIALLLGGIGVASAIHVFVQRELPSVAVLRCLGAGTRQLLAIYLLQAGALGLAGSLFGVGVGAVAQLALPLLVRGMLPVDVDPELSASAAVGGIAVGVAVAVLFSLLPLLAVREVAPLAVLRSIERRPALGRDLPRLLAAAVLALGVFAIAALQAGGPGQGLAFTGGLAAALLALWLVALGLVRGLRRRFPSRLPYLWRQGLANLYRPANQTLTVVLALGFGAFLLATLYVVQDNLLRDLRLDRPGERPNLAFIDVQPDQREVFGALLRESLGHVPDPTPVVPMRILEVKGRRVREILYDTRERQGREGRWAFRREYRSSYRDGLSDSERLVAGESWPPPAGEAEGPIPVSLEEGVAAELGVGVGDTIVWDVQGLPVSSRVSSLRDVEWARFEPNFFALFPDGPLREAPQTFAYLARVEKDDERARLQRRVVERLPNVTVIDLSAIQATLEGLIAHVALAVRFTAAFSLVAGAAVLAGAVGATRLQRLRESVLLEVLGATRRQVLLVLLAEYLTLGSIAALAAIALSLLGGWALAALVFETRFRIPLLPLAALGVGLAGLTVAGGLLASLGLLRRTPLEALRTE